MGDHLRELSIDGVVAKVSSGLFCEVLLENGVVMQAILSGNMRRNSIRVSAGDKVKVEITSNSPNLGRVVCRY